MEELLISPRITSIAYAHCLDLLHTGALGRALNQELNSGSVAGLNLPELLHRDLLTGRRLTNRHAAG